MTTIPPHTPRQALAESERMLAEFEAAGPRFARSAETVRRWIENFRQQWREETKKELKEQRTN